MKSLWSHAALLATLLMPPLAARADISPTRFVGTGIVAQTESNVRMEKASVEIVWGTPCSLTATFKMVNSAGTAQEIRVGFPMPGTSFGQSSTEVPNDLTITFNDQPATVLPPDGNPERRSDRRDWLWYHCQHSFQPGATTVVVKTPLNASAVSGMPYCQALYYCIETGGKWAGTIGEEEVTIRFPGAPGDKQIFQASPTGYDVDGTCVRWRFRDIKPKGNEYDIELKYVRPAVARVLANVRQNYTRQPESSAAALKLAKHLLALGDGKSNSGFPPDRLSKEEYTSIAKRIGSRSDRKLFEARYRVNREGQYEEIETEWTNERQALVQILADAGYRDERSRAPVILEAESLLKAVLAREPQNAEAWNTYLASYWRFGFAAVGHGFGMTRLSAAQAKLIETAAKNCPDDTCIRLWLELRRNFDKGTVNPELFDEIRRRGFTAVEYPEIVLSDLF